MLLTLSDLQNEVMRETGLTTASKSTITARLNDYYSQICGEEDWKWLEKTFDITTVANQDSYDLDVNHVTIKTVYLQKTATDKTVPLREIVNPSEWDTISNFYNNSASDFPYLYHIRLGKIYIFPKITTAGYTLKVLCVANPLPMEVEDYSTGSISVTAGSTSVVGSGTAWLANIKSGSKIKIERTWYEISSVTNNTTLVLTKAYQGSTKSGITDYKIGDAPILPDNYHSILWKMFCEEYFAKNPSGRKHEVYEKLVAKMRLGLEKVSSSESSTNIWDNNPTLTEYYGRDPYIVYPD